MLTTSFANFNDFLHMGGYAWYVWSAYACCAVVLAIQAICARLKRPPANSPSQNQS